MDNCYFCSEIITNKKKKNCCNPDCPKERRPTDNKLYKLALEKYHKKQDQNGTWTGGIFYSFKKLFSQSNTKQNVSHTATSTLHKVQRNKRDKGILS